MKKAILPHVFSLNSLDLEFGIHECFETLSKLAGRALTPYDPMLRRKVHQSQVLGSEALIVVFSHMSIAEVTAGPDSTGRDHLQINFSLGRTGFSARQRASECHIARGEGVIGRCGEAFNVVMDRDQPPTSDARGLAIQLDRLPHADLFANEDLLLAGRLAGPAIPLLQAYIYGLVSGPGPAEPTLIETAGRHVAELISLALQPGQRHGAESRATALSRARFEAARRYIRANLTDLRLSDASISAHIGVSDRQIRKDFEAVGLSPASYIRDQRLKLARQMLRSPMTAAMTVIDIAFSCGFRDLSTFNRAFRRAFGMTPSELRGELPPSGGE